MVRDCWMPKLNSVGEVMCFEEGDQPWFYYYVLIAEPECCHWSWLILANICAVYGESPLFLISRFILFPLQPIHLERYFLHLLLLTLLS